MGVDRRRGTRYADAYHGRTIGLRGRFDPELASLSSRSMRRNAFLFPTRPRMMKAAAHPRERYTAPAFAHERRRRLWGRGPEWAREELA